MDEGVPLPEGDCLFSVEVMIRVKQTVIKLVRSSKFRRNRRWVQQGIAEQKTTHWLQGCHDVLSCSVRNILGGVATTHNLTKLFSAFLSQLVFIVARSAQSGTNIHVSFVTPDHYSTYACITEL